MTVRFITLTRMTRGNEDDTTSLLIYPDHLQVIGNLPHAASIKPHTFKDAQRMFNWLLASYPALENVKLEGTENDC